MVILLDSSVVIASERAQLDLDAIAQRHSTDQIVLSAVGLAELLYGIEKRPIRYRVPAREFLDRLLARFFVVAFDAAAAEQHAALRLQLEKKGASLGHNDLLIASIALTHGLAIAARDKDFARIPDLIVLRW